MTDLKCGVIGSRIKYKNPTDEKGKKLIGFNAGMVQRSEHMTSGQYEGPELCGAMYTKENPFGGETITNPEAIQLIEYEGKVILTNTEMPYTDDRFIEHLFESAFNHPDRDEKYRDFERNKVIEIAPNAKDQLQQPEQEDIIGIWNNWSFELVSTNENGSEVLRTLYEEMLKKNVAISRRNSFIFDKCPGLSFVILSELTEEDYEKKGKIEEMYESHEQCSNTGTRPPYGYYSFKREKTPITGDFQIGDDDLSDVAEEQRSGTIAQIAKFIVSKIPDNVRNFFSPHKSNNDRTKE